MTSIGEELHDFMDTAAAMQSLDLVITLDTSVGHLARCSEFPYGWALSFAAEACVAPGAVGHPLVSFDATFPASRWGDWAEVFAQMAAELPNLIEARESRIDKSAPD